MDSQKSKMKMKSFGNKCNKNLQREERLAHGVRGPEEEATPTATAVDERQFTWGICEKK